MEQPAIKDYAIIGDCRTAALVSRDGSIDWLCLPDFSSPSVFARLIDEEGGYFAIRPRDICTVKRRYIGSTAVLETTFETSTGVLRLVDLFPIVDGATSLAPMRELLRITECVSGSIELEIIFNAQPNYRRTPIRMSYRCGFGWRGDWANELIVLNTKAELVPSGTGLSGNMCLRTGERQHFSLAYVRGDVASVAPLGLEADERCEHTTTWWRNWTLQCSFDGRERDSVLRSAVTLKLLTSCLSGALIAAPTTSLPEAIGAKRNWDYRYCWMRDAGLAMNAFIGLGFHAEAEAYLNWLLHATRLTWPRLNLVYDTYGRTHLREQKLAHLSGYRHSQPVRIGNNAVDQLQLDAYGQVIVAADAFASGGQELDATEQRMLRGFGDVICKIWREPDNGIWEIADRRRQYTLSKMLCWVALDRLLSLEKRGIIKLKRRCELFARECEAIGRCIEEHGFNSQIDSYTGVLDGQEVDAGLLLMVCVAYKNATDPRAISTYARIQRDLSRTGLLYRYRPGSDGMAGEEGAFGICGFWAVDHLAERGQIEEAERYFDHLVSFANDVGLFAEEIDPGTGAALGNFPQAFTHVGLIYAALSLRKARRKRAA
ncbi:glycoside hydrolase family 15 protein [Bradyrhizobium sp. WSM1743]|uniref:glycoside hydrolase family 15 protein n=1 Tax=Bradyrhizobium sp. WSM1743 TaxID=318996 RepID=UPI00042A6774|nr:glycoside hydrolase family 15 protein [Bradyrhizobium sp. WSM1743]